MKKYRCFVICAIGEPGSEIRQDADDLLDLIIKPALEIYDFEVLRGDHRSEPNQIDIDVIESVQNADLCIIDLSRPNPNVYYELGRRDECGKPRILLKSKDSEDLPVDIATQRYIQYDFGPRHGVRDAIAQIRSFVEPMIQRGFESTTGASLSDIATALSRIERKMDRITGKGSGSRPLVLDSKPANIDGDPHEVFRLALRQSNLPLIDSLLDQLALRVDKLQFLDFYAEMAVAHGSKKAGQMLLDNAEEFIDSSVSFHKKIEYLGVLVSHLNHVDGELENAALIESLTDNLWEMRDQAEDPADIAQIFNQRNRLYHGIYSITDDVEWLNKAIAVLEQAKEYAPSKSYIFFNLATCYYDAKDLLRARENALYAIEMDRDEKPDADHLQLMCKILRALDDPQYPEMLERLRSVSAVKAALLEST